MQLKSMNCELHASLGPVFMSGGTVFILTGPGPDRAVASMYEARLVQTKIFLECAYKRNEKCW